MNAPRNTEAFEERVDDGVVGSSPMMLLQADLLARAGRRVCLVEREARLGGSWQTATLESGETVEIACHLIEFFPGIYELLEEASDTPFVALDAQPIRIHPTGLTVPYLSRMLMLATGARLFAGWAKARLDWALGRTNDRNRLINFQTKLSSYLRYQGPAFFQRPIMKGPKHGFVDFMDRLEARARHAGVAIQGFDVSQMSRIDQGPWKLTSAAGSTLYAEHVHCTTSTNLRRAGDGHFQAVPQTFAQRFCVVAEVQNNDIHISQSYVAFWKNPAVARISRIDMPGTYTFQRFLIEFHNPDSAADSDLSDVIRKHLENAKIIAAGGSFEIVGHVNCQFTTNVDQLPSGKIDNNLWGYYSMGNLAAGLAAWRKAPRLPALLAGSCVERKDG